MPVGMAHCGNRDQVLRVYAPMANMGCLAFEAIEDLIIFATRKEKYRTGNTKFRVIPVEKGIYHSNVYDHNEVTIPFWILYIARPPMSAFSSRQILASQSRWQLNWKGNRGDKSSLLNPLKNISRELR